MKIIIVEHMQLNQVQDNINITYCSVARAPIDALRPRRLRRRKPLRFKHGLPGGRLFDVFEERPLGGRFRAVRRITTLLLWTLVAIPVQALLLLLPGRPKVVFARVYHSVLCRLLGLQGAGGGQPGDGRPTLFLSNHSSWLDVLVLGGVLEGCFVSKAEVGTWPLIRTVARLGRTVFVSRSRGRTGSEADGMQARLAAGDSLILFPEGTSNDGARTLPFRSSFLATAGAARQVQPVSWSTTGWAGCRPAGGTGRCSPGTATWRSAATSGGWPGAAAPAPPSCCTSPSTRRPCRTARRWRWPPGRRSRPGRTGCGRTARRCRWRPCPRQPRRIQVHGRSDETVA